MWLGRFMSAQLVAVTDGRVIQIDKSILVVGRHVECDVQILSPKVSRLHCCIAQIGEYLVVRDLNSTNGIRINGLRVIEGRLGAGDELAIGTHCYRVRGDGLAVGHAGHDKSPDKRSDKRGANAAVGKDLESCEEPVALPEPASPPAKKKNRRSEMQPAPDRDDNPGGQVSPVVVPPVVEIPAPVLEEEPMPPLPNPLELISGGDEMQNPSSHPPA